MEVIVGTLVFLLLVVVFLPSFLVFLAIQAGLHVVQLAFCRHHGGGTTQSAFFYRRRIRWGRDVSPGSAFFQEEPPLLPPECCDRLAVVLYHRKGPAEAADCVFCLSEVADGEEVRELRCCHVFHRACLDAWLVRPRAKCPLCRELLLPPEPPHAMAAGDDFSNH